MKNDPQVGCVREIGLVFTTQRKVKWGCDFIFGLRLGVVNLFLGSRIGGCDNQKRGRAACGPLLRRSTQRQRVHEEIMP